MGGRSIFRSALFGVIAATAIGVTFAAAQETARSGSVNFSDPANLNPDTPTLDLSVSDDSNARFSPSGGQGLPPVQGPRRLELELAAGGGDSPVDVSVAQRASIGADANGDVNRRGAGSELRVGRGLVDRRNNNGDGSSVYAFVASDNEALTWRPGARTDFGGRGDAFTLQEQVEIGDMSAGITYERNGVQASLAYVEREESTRVGHESFSEDRSFTGITVTMRR